MERLTSSFTGLAFFVGGVLAFIKYLGKLQESLLDMFAWRREFTNNNELCQLVEGFLIAERPPRLWGSLKVALSAPKLNDGLLAEPGKDNLEYSLSYGMHIVYYNNVYLVISKGRRDNVLGGLASPTEFLVIYARKEGTIKDIIDTAHARKGGGVLQTCVYYQLRDLRYWAAPVNRVQRPLSTVYLDKRAKDKLVGAVKNFLDPATREYYIKNGIPYRLTILIYGPPGTGKTSACMALAGEFGLSVRLFEDLRKMPGSTFGALIRDIGIGIGLIEDLDRSGLSWINGESFPAHPDELSQSGFLNGLDGLAAGEGQIMLITANDTGMLSNAVLRPRRVSLTIRLGHVTKEVAREMFSDTCPDATKAEIEEFVQLVPDEKISSARLRDICVPMATAGDVINNLKKYQEESAKEGSSQAIKLHHAKAKMSWFRLGK